MKNTKEDEKNYLRRTDNRKRELTEMRIILGIRDLK